MPFAGTEAKIGGELCMCPPPLPQHTLIPYFPWIRCVCGRRRQTLFGYFGCLGPLSHLKGMLEMEADPLSPLIGMRECYSLSFLAVKRRVGADRVRLALP
jgi:hypothetical protein